MSPTADSSPPIALVETKNVNCVLLQRARRHTRCLTSQEKKSTIDTSNTTNYLLPYLVPRKRECKTSTYVQLKKNTGVKYQVRVTPSPSPWQGGKEREGRGSLQGVEGNAQQPKTRIIISNRSPPLRIVHACTATKPKTKRAQHATRRGKTHRGTLNPSGPRATRCRFQENNLPIYTWYTRVSIIM